jgi:hypothetical protein
VPSQAATLREHDPVLVPDGYLKVAWGGMDQYPVGGGVGADPAACNDKPVAPEFGNQRSQSSSIGHLCLSVGLCLVRLAAGATS